MTSSNKKIKTEYEIKIDDSSKKLSEKLEIGKIYKCKLEFKDKKFNDLSANLVLKTRKADELDGLNAEKMLENDQKLLKELNSNIQREIDLVKKGDEYRVICNLILDSMSWILLARRTLFMAMKSAEEVKKIKDFIIKTRSEIRSDQPIPSGILTKMFKNLLGTTLENVRLIVKEVLDEY